MPPIQQQQTSRGGLIAALVVTIVFAVGILVFAIMANADLKAAALPADPGLTRLVTNLPTKVSGDAAALEKARADLKKASDDLQAEIANHKAEIGKRDQAVSEAQASAAKTTADCKAAI